MTSVKKLILLAIFLNILALSSSNIAFAGNPVVSDSDLVVTNIVFPDLPEVSRTGAIYLTFENNSDKDIVLKDVATDVAHHAMIHQTKEVDGVVKMAHVDELIIPTKGKLEFKRGDYHVMLMGVDKELIKKPFDVTFSFAKRKDLTIKVKP